MIQLSHLSQISRTVDPPTVKSSANTQKKSPLQNTNKSPYGAGRHTGLNKTAIKQAGSVKLTGSNSLGELQACCESGSEVEDALTEWKTKHAHTGEFLNTTTAGSALGELYQIYDNSDLSMDEFIEAVQEQGADELMGKMAGLTAFRAVSGLESVEYLARAVDSDNGADAVYNGMQSVLTMGAKTAPKPIKWAFKLTSELLKVKEGRGLVHKYYAEPMSRSDGYQLARNADVSYKNPMFGSSEMQNMGANLETVQGGFKSLDKALGFIGEEQDNSFFDRYDYAVAKEKDGSFTVMNLDSTWILGDDMNDASVLESVVIRNDNPHNLVALVAEDGAYGTVKKEGVYPKTGSPRWSIEIQGKVP